jgi:hypothetical protein
MLQTQLKESKLEVEDLKRRNENLSQQNSRLNLKPFLTSLQIQNPMFAQQPIIQASNIQSTANSLLLNSSPTTSHFNNMDTLMQVSGSLSKFIDINQ